MSLSALLGRLIAERGPLDVGAYMQLALGHPTLGYYRTRDPFGLEGDFITAPELSQVFGELLGLAVAQRWLELGGPAPALLVELGPGRGTLMADIRRATARVAGFHDAVDLHLVETSPRLRELQRKRLEGLRLSWHDDLVEVPAGGPLFVIANELLDALPVRQFERTRLGWRERMVTLGPGGALGFALAPAVTPFAAELMRRHPGAPLGQLVELSPAREALVAAIGRRLARHDGLALLIDYGARHLDGPTLQAVRGHGRADPLESPGEVDLSSHVAFGELAEAAEGAGAVAWGPLAQGEFLTRLGAGPRVDRLAAAKPEAAPSLRDGLARIVDPARMGQLFKVLALTGTPAPPPGFDPGERFGP
jgi:NADH dehydrogenase [ubiquinone] 1 alpha subcomplex assembly factor 7